MKWLAIHLAVVMTLLAGQVQAADSSPSEAVSPEQALLDVQKKPEKRLTHPWTRMSGKKLPACN